MAKATVTVGRKGSDVMLRDVQAGEFFVFVDDVGPKVDLDSLAGDKVWQRLRVGDTDRLSRALQQDALKRRGQTLVSNLAGDLNLCVEECAVIPADVTIEALVQT